MMNRMRWERPPVTDAGVIRRELEARIAAAEKEWNSEPTEESRRYSNGTVDGLRRLLAYLDGDDESILGGRDDSGN